MRVDIVTRRDGEEVVVEYDYAPREEDERPMVLDVLLQAQATEMPDLAFRYGCRARNCGVCTVDINDRPRIACRARIKEGDRVSPMASLPALSDLVVRRDGVARQMRGRLATVRQGNDLNVNAPTDYHALTGCIECYACLHECPMHARNFGGGLPANQSVEEQPDPGAGYPFGNPFTLLKLQRIRLDPLTSEAGKTRALENAIDLGLDACVGCKGCKCGVGIDLMGIVVRPLLETGRDQICRKD
ncbi:MAG: Fumarate reductase iron-sulfur subunit [Alphaproteobacteria bacterium MarineAlpha11_Bin1]|nr:MAG: Fumarate reductase iron-sulfur subunit [Alphaproteobacteria bacterium MarineAlpha11_Bin1]|tara:strand:+ start:1423 stop:2154 length:732 start_codon:yes stop_codon:yes gene_type:complete